MSGGPSPDSLVALLTGACVRHRDRVAVVHAGRAHRYAELDAESARIAAGLAARGVRAGDTVGLLGPRGWWRCAAVLGVWRAGAAVNPLDPALPVERLARIVRAAGTRLVLRDPDTAPVPADAEQVAVDRIGAEAADGSGQLPLPAGASASDGPLAYVVATSGSTGTPKCVAVPPVVLADLAAWHRDRWRHPEPPRTLHAASVGFDVGFQELAATWAAGAELVVADDATRFDPFRLAEFLAERRIARAFLPVGALLSLAVAVPVTGHRPEALREVVTAGERLVVNAEVRALFAGLDAALVNQYGPSETHVVTEYRLPPGDPDGWPVHPPLGTAAVSAELLRLSADGLLRPFADGDEAELHVAGRALAIGYLGDDELTARRFRRLPHVDGRMLRVYATGDRVRREGGLLHFVGRTDDQLKVRGYRVEPGEVEAVLGRVPGVRRAAVVGHHRGGSTALHAYLVLGPGGDGTVDAARLRAACAAELPDYMVPVRFLTVRELPLTRNGKVARGDIGAAATGTVLR
ncbi:AMP-binding protein [Streptomyces sp. NPDC090306]|uniref:AMP-binding protein n=1 Tax=Streptomyces sp. NPDC090306 TaxID=3365961 RepID=UPI00382B4B19